MAAVTEQFTKPATRNSIIRMPMAIDPLRIRLAWRSAEAGDPAKLFAVLEHFLKIDDEIKSATKSVHAAVLSGGVSIVPDESAGQEAVRQAEFFNKLFGMIDFEGMVKELMLSEYYGVKAIAFPEEVWDVVTIEGRSYQAPMTFELVPNSWIYAKKANAAEDYTRLYVGDKLESEYQEGSIICQTETKLPAWEDIDFTRLGYGVACMRLAGFKYYDYEDWAAFNETFATPLILGKTGQGGNQDVVRKAVQEMGHDSRAVVGQNDEILFPEANKSSSVDAYEKFAHAIDKAISKLIKSESLTDNMGSAGSYAAMKTTNGVRLDVALELANKTARQIHRKLMLPLAGWNFSGNLLCSIKFNVKGNVDMTQQANVDSKLLRHMDGSEKHLRKKYSFPAPADDEDRIKRQAGSSIMGV
jgi:phage gp29-like protein